MEIKEIIKTQRLNNKLTQNQLAQELNVSTKTISKWETGRGYPDIVIIKDLARALHVSINELLSGQIQSNNNQSGNMLKTKFYVCPTCGNIIVSTGQSDINCCGNILLPQIEKEENILEIEKIEDEYYISSKHPMEKDHYLSFIIGQGVDYLTIKKQYPQSIAQAHFKISGLKNIYAYCTKDGLYKMKIK